MKIQSFVLLIIVVPCSVFAQLSGIVKDSISGEPIPYVNIWVESENTGTNSEENGSFVLHISEEKNIVFSALGYETKTISSKEIAKVYLRSKNIQLEELILEKPKQTEELVLNDYKGKKVRSCVSNSGLEKVHIWGKIIDYNNSVVKYPFIKKIQFKAKSKVKVAKMRLRIFKKPYPEQELKDLIEDDIIFEVKKGKREVTVDLSPYNLSFPKEGILIGFEYLKIEQNKHVYSNSIRGKKGKHRSFKYEPTLRAYKNTNPNNGVVVLIEKNNKFMYYHIISEIDLAVKITLSN